ncbi:hypothetical protein GCM10023185_41690 [Hymenobacter saemangeumensis]|uniref:Membrane or secreted protein n=1 Tax=Hymenobacter saemangeumensis TaxID=1084522 RepID=A0ABP8IRG6_9BACT
MKSKIMMLSAAALLSAGGALFGFTAHSKVADCPLKGTPDCPLVKNCPDKGTPACKLATMPSCCVRQ